MAKISLLPEVAEPTGSETVPVVVDGVTKRVPIGKLTEGAVKAQFAAAGPWRTVATYGARDNIPGKDRFPGLVVSVVEAGLVFEFEGDPVLDVGNRGWRFPSWTVDNHVVFIEPPVLDGDTLYFSDFYVLAYGQNGYGEYYFSPGGRVASPISTGTSARRHVFDRRVIRAGGSLADAIKEVEDNSSPQRDTHDEVVLAVTRAGRLIDTLGRPFVGRVPGGSVGNEFRYGRVPDETPFIFPGAVPAAITDAAMLADGFTRGIRGAPNSIVAYGDYRPTPIRAGDYLVARFRLIAEADGAFGQPRLYLYTSEQQAGFVVPPVFREISPRVREYLYVGRATADGVGKWAVGTDAGAFASRVWVAGAQFHCGPDPAFWIDSSDFPAPIDVAPLMADRLYMVSDRPLPLIVANGFADRATEAMAELTSSVVPALPTADQSVFESGRAQDVRWLDPVTIGAGATLAVRAREAPHLVHARTIPVSVRQVPVTPRRAIKVGYFGDSQSASLFARYLRTYLSAWGIDVTFYGSLDNSIGDQPGEVRQYGEGRGGWGLANFIGGRQEIGGAGSGFVWDAVLGSGQSQTDAYRGGSFDQRHRTNPYLSNEASGSAAPVIGRALPLIGGGTAAGFRFDLVAYRTRFALPDLDIVLTNLGQNDINQLGGVAGLAAVDLYYPILLAEIRRAWPGAMILGWGEAPAYVDRSEIRWRERRPAAVAQLAAVRARTAGGDARVRFVSTWMHHTIRSSFPLAAGMVDPVTGSTRTTIADPTHADHTARAQSLESLAAAIINSI